MSVIFRPARAQNRIAFLLQKLTEGWVTAQLEKRETACDRARADYVPEASDPVQVRAARFAKFNYES